MTVLRQLSGAGGNFGQGAAGACNRASQPFYKHPWGVRSHTLAILFLPSFVRKFLSDNRRANGYHFMDEPSMQALAMRREFAFLRGQSLTGSFVPLAVMPALFALLDSPFVVV